MITESGDYKVTVELGSDTTLAWSGWAQNTTDALAKAMEKRTDEYNACVKRGEPSP